MNTNNTSRAKTLHSYNSHALVYWYRDIRMKWKCDVCGYIHTGDEPPAVCPVCGVDKTHFHEIEEDEGK